jgi:hypothetical protein
MELRFKQFQGRVLMNRHVGIEARLNVFKTVVMTNGVYACETWNYTTNDIARIERHYFRLLRDVLLMSRSADPATTFFSVIEYAAQQGIEEIFPMECLIQRQQLKFLWKIVHLEDTAIQKIVLFGKISSQYNGRKGGRRQTYVNCLKLALANFGVSMKECMEMTELDWEFLINNQALLEATAKWKAKPSALKTIDNFWAPGIQTRGKRKRIIAEDDEDDGTEDPLSSDKASRTVTAVNSSADNRMTTEQMDGEPPVTVNYRKRRRRQQFFKSLRVSRPPRQIFTGQSTQDFSTTENNVTDEETFDHRKDAEVFEEQGELVQTANQYANECAADALILRMEERFGFDRAASNSRMEVVGQPKDAVNGVEKLPSEANRRQEGRQKRNNVVRRRHRNAMKTKRNINLSSDPSMLEPLRLILGREKVPIQDDTQSNSHSIAWAHRTLLGQIARGVQ